MKFSVILYVFDGYDAFLNIIQHRPPTTRNCVLEILKMYAPLNTKFYTF